MAVDRHHLGDFAPYIFVSEDRGASFAPIGAGLPRGWVNDVVEHPQGENFLVAGTEVGAFYSFDRGGSWVRAGGGLPHVPVDDIEIHPRERDLVFGTHGRSIYILDDSAPLAWHDPETGGAELFEPRPALVFLPWKHESYEGQARYAGENPPVGALLTVFLPDAGEVPAALEIRDSSGEVVASPAVETRPGFQRIVWDLRAGAASEDAPGICGAAPPRVPTGTYEVRLTGAGDVAPVPLEVQLDPSVAVSEAAYAQRAAFLAEIHAVIREACRVGEAAGDPDALSDAAREAVRQLRPGGGFRNPSTLARLGRLYGEFTGDDVRQGTLDAPTMVHRRRFEALRTQIEEAIAVVGDSGGGR